MSEVCVSFASASGSWITDRGTVIVGKFSGAMGIIESYAVGKYFGTGVFTLHGVCGMFKGGEVITDNIHTAVVVNAWQRNPLRDWALAVPMAAADFTGAEMVLTGSCGGPEDCTNDDPDVCSNCDDFIFEGLALYG